MFGMKLGGGLRHTEFGNCDAGMPHPSEVRGLAHLLTDSMLTPFFVIYNLFLPGPF